MIRVNNVSKSFGNHTAIRRLSLEIPAQQTTVLLGSSGCGKSTLLRMIQGLISYDEGSIHLNEFTVSPETQNQISQKFGYVIQQGGLFPHLSARENILLQAKLNNRDSDWMTTRLEELTELVALHRELLEKFPSQLSGGQAQRVSLMRALMLNPDILVLDEPLGALDPLIRSELQEELKAIFNRLKKTVVIVTHDIGEAAHFGHLVVLMRDGKIEQAGAFKELVESPHSEFVSAFLKAQKPAPELEALR